MCDLLHLAQMVVGVEGGTQEVYTHALEVMRQEQGLVAKSSPRADQDPGWGPPRSHTASDGMVVRNEGNRRDLDAPQWGRLKVMSGVVALESNARWCRHGNI